RLRMIFKITWRGSTSMSRFSKNGGPSERCSESTTTDACRGAAFGQSGMPKMVTLEPAAGKSQILAFLAILLHHENRALTGDIGCLARLGTIARPLAHIS